MQYVLHPAMIVFLALVFNLPVGLLAIKNESLTIPDGLSAAGLLGLILFLAHPLYWVLLLTFFVSSTLLTRYQQSSSDKQNAMDYAEKGGKRDAPQVLANGGIPLFISLLTLLLGLWQAELDQWYTLLFVTSLAVVNSDTWATELGVTSSSQPVWILNPTKKVPRGTSGGVSLLGSIASLFGALLMAIIFLIGSIITKTSPPPSFFLLIVAGGLLGSVIDSVLGATIQAQFSCQICNKITEKRFHCDSKTNHSSGIIWFNNDTVNFFSVVISVSIIYGLSLLG